MSQPAHAPPDRSTSGRRTPAIAAIRAALAALCALVVCQTGPADAAETTDAPSSPATEPLRCGDGSSTRTRQVPRHWLDEHAALPAVVQSRRCETADAVAQGDTAEGHGAGRSFVPVWRGTYRMGMRDGRWMQFARDGRLLGANQLKLGAGSWTVWHEDGFIAARGQLRQGRRDGTWRYYFEGGRLAAVASWEDGSLHGDVVLFHREDLPGRPGVPAPALRCAHRAGVPHGYCELTSVEGEKLLAGRYRAGARVGVWEQRNPHGRLLGVSRLDNAGNGVWHSLRDDGSVRLEGGFDGGRPSGTWSWLDRRGQVERAREARTLRGLMDPDGGASGIRGKRGLLHGKGVLGALVGGGGPPLHLSVRGGMVGGLSAKVRGSARVSGGLGVRAPRKPPGGSVRPGPRARKKLHSGPLKVTGYRDKRAIERAVKRIEPALAACARRSPTAGLGRKRKQTTGQPAVVELRWQQGPGNRHSVRVRTLGTGQATQKIRASCVQTAARAVRLPPPDAGPSGEVHWVILVP